MSREAQEPEHLDRGDEPWWRDPWLRDRRVWALALTIGLAIAGHLWFWYAPRFRPSLPDEGPAARLLRHETLPLAVWIPFPHQNLALMERRLGVELQTLRGALDAAELPNPSLPRFGNLPHRVVKLAPHVRAGRLLAAGIQPPAVLKP